MATALADAEPRVQLRDILTLVGGALQTYYFACAHGEKICASQPCAPCDLGPWQFGQISGGPPIDPLTWAASDKALLWRTMNAAYVRIAQAIGREDLRGFIADDHPSGFPLLGARAAKNKVAELVGLLHLDSSRGATAITFGPSALTRWLEVGSGRASPAIAASAIVGGAVLGVVASALASKA